MISRKNLRATMFLAASAAALGAPGVASGQEVAVERDKVERDARERAHTSDIVVTGQQLHGVGNWRTAARAALARR